MTTANKEALDDEDEVDDIPQAKPPAQTKPNLETAGTTEEPDGTDEDGSAVITLEDDPEEDARLSADDQSETVDEKRERRRQERHRRKENQRRAKDNALRMEQELADTRAQLNQVLGQVGSVNEHIGQQQVQQLQQRASQLQYEIREATSLIAKAASVNDGESMTQALEIRDSARMELNQLNAAYSAYQQNQKAAQQRQRSAPQVDPAVKRNTDTFLSSHDWIDPIGRDEDSKTALAIDAQVAAEGYLPSKPAYWTELDKRLRKNLPHRFDGDDDGDDEDGGAQRAPIRASSGGSVGSSPAQTPRGGPPVASGNGGARPGAQRVKISRERVEAMKEAGIWDDPVRRQKQVKAYIAYDRQHSNAAR